MKNPKKMPKKVYGFEIGKRIYDVKAPNLRDAKAKFVGIAFEIEILGELKGSKPKMYGFRIGQRIYDVKAENLRDAKVRLVNKAHEIDVLGELLHDDKREKSKIVRGVRIMGDIGELNESF